MPIPRILWIGNEQYPEFKPAVDWLRAHATFKTAIVPEAAPPDAVILGQSRPGEFSPERAGALRAEFPLATIVVLPGSWCDSEARVGRLLPGIVRVPWHAWHARFPHSLRRLLAGRTGPWSLPALSTDEERSFHAAEQQWPAAGGQIVVRTLVYETWSSLADLLSAAGASAYWLRWPGDAARGAAAILWDLARLNDGELSQIAATRRRLAAPVVVLASFPRPADVQRLCANGAASVLAKPFAAEDLLNLLDQARIDQQPPSAPFQRASIAQTTHFVQ